MRLTHLTIASFILLCGCAQPESASRTNTDIHLYSPGVGDSFMISVQLPEDYHPDSTRRYPVVFMGDGNFHFPMLAATVRQYERGGLLPPLILVGINYGSLQLMDSLRTRDFLYPAALPSDEMAAPGGGKAFEQFVTGQLVPYIDSAYHTDKSRRALLGHSFGGYFTLNALLDQQPVFRYIVSASPSLWYHDFYLDKRADSISRQGVDTVGLFLTVGGAEDSTWSVAPVQKMAAKLGHAPGIDLQYRLYPHLDHMDVAQLSFIQGLRHFYPME